MHWITLMLLLQAPAALTELPSFQNPFPRTDQSDSYDVCKLSCSRQEVGRRQQCGDDQACLRYASLLYRDCLFEICQPVLESLSPEDLQKRGPRDCSYFMEHIDERRICSGISAGKRVEREECESLGCCYDESSVDGDIQCFIAEEGQTCPSCCGGCQNKYIKLQNMCPGDKMMKTRVVAYNEEVRCQDPGTMCNRTLTKIETYEVEEGPYCCAGFMQYDGKCRGF